jgi:hypothetical protein
MLRLLIVRDLTDCSRLHCFPTIITICADLWVSTAELVEYGWAQSMHLSIFLKGESLRASLLRHERYLAAQMSLRPGMRVLDTGSGVGGFARQITVLSDANIVGLNDNLGGQGSTPRRGLSVICEYWNNLRTRVALVCFHV